MDLDFEGLRSAGNTRKPLFAPHGVVATSQPLAAQAGLAALRQGGNAVDAALATAITLTVVEPTSNDVGGDTFAIVWDGTRLHGLNGSGRAAQSHTIDLMQREGYEKMPERGWLSVTVPGTPAAWRDLHRRFGRLPFPALFESAIEYAEHGYPVSPVLAFNWAWQVEQVHPLLGGPEFEGFGPLLAPLGRAPHTGEWWRNEALARTLRLIAATEAAAFYSGEIAEMIVAFAERTGGLLRAEDLVGHMSTWVEPISTDYRGYTVWELPPNGQGLAALMALNILEGYDMAELPYGSDERFHLQAEAMKLAFMDAWRYIGDPEHSAIPVAELLSKEYAADRRRLIGSQARLPAAGNPMRGNTVYLCTADAEGMMVSLIQSNFHNFGSHVAVPGTGIVLQNRGSGFVLDPDHPNALAPGKRPFHTIIPGFLTHEGEPMGPFGVMGGHMQPQGHVQVIMNTIDYGMDPQRALDAGRWFWLEKRLLQLEPWVAPEIAVALTARGHQIEVDFETNGFGRGQIIWRLPGGGYVAGSDNRADGAAVGF